MLRICPPQPRRDISAPNSRQVRVVVRAWRQRILSIRSTGVCRMSRNEKAPALLTRTSTSRPRACTRSKSSCAASGRARSIGMTSTANPYCSWSSSAAASSFRRIESCEDQPVSEFGQPPGHAAPDAAAGTRHQSGPAPFFDRSLACHYGSFASSSRIFRGRSPQCLQHFISTEYMRAMQ